MSGLLSDLLYFEVEKELLELIFVQYARQNGISETGVGLLLKKIKKYGEENISELDLLEPNGIGISKRHGMNKWLSSIGELGTSAIDVMKSYIKKDPNIPTEEDEQKKEEEDQDKTESTAGMS